MKNPYVPGINHIEFWVKNLEESVRFYGELFPLIGWYALNETSFSCGQHEIYFKEMPVDFHDSLGVRHICFHAISPEVVDAVEAWLRRQNADMIRGPLEMPHYSTGYYTVDFRDPNGFVLEVAYTPNARL
ncbi:VOC family protein [Pontibacter amylolyticus]|uniref:VOC domain-containing protein n=1 Tax=Pontibacter amylolyticus TaxID=1424080 RepID=A0ABQ1W3T5_9BACT|nr:VOC family protein [Pontibacter amylolyticus]GGG13749.1 hypothetical protein GCM10011323_17720 [Pontibacter amylolyticus]